MALRVQGFEYRLGVLHAPAVSAYYELFRHKGSRILQD